VDQHISGLRETKASIEFPVILGFLQDLTANVALDSDIQPWDVIGMFVTRLSNDVNAILPEIQRTMADGQLLTGKRVQFVWHSTVTERSCYISTVASAVAGTRRCHQAGNLQQR
jgi:hypothetical protein